MQPAQLSLMPQEGTTPPQDLLAHLPDPAVATALGELARVIANAAAPTIAEVVSSDE